MRRPRGWLPPSISSWRWAAAGRVFFLCLSLELCRASVSCNDSYNPCQDLLWKGSQCVNGSCSNPFQKGCLHTLLNTDDKYNHYTNSSNQRLQALVRRLKTKRRVCNSDDDPGIYADNKDDNDNDDDRLCLPPPMAYREIRITSQNWESAMFVAWMQQILLSELLDVPVTIETGRPDLHLNFYHPENSFQYSNISYDWNALRNAHALKGDCSQARNGNKNGYKSCGHAVPEVWSSQLTSESEVPQLLRDGIIETPQVSGAVGQQSWYVPKFTARANPAVTTLFGLEGDHNRHKLAAMFLRPTTWKEYCDIVSNNSCALPDAVATRAPLDETEYDRMHVPYLYTGHFRSTDKNNCTKYPTNCTGHIADYPCGWNSFVQAQTYHLKIALESDGKEEGSHGYSYSQLTEMWAAANATKSHLIALWWSPEAMYSTYIGTDTELHKVSLSIPTQECMDHRIRPDQRCNYSSEEEKYGDPKGACDDVVSSLHRVMLSINTDPNINKIPEAQQSPAYETLTVLRVSELQLGDILKNWLNRGIDKWNFDPRMATCQWMADNLEFVESFLPLAYPRIVREQTASELPLFHVAIAFAVIATGMVALSLVLTYLRRHRAAMKRAQVDFLFLVLLGLLMVAVASILLVVQPNDASCTASSWLIVIGYSLELAPIIVKVYAINQLLAASRQFKRLSLARRQLYGFVFALGAVAAVFCILWTVLDPPNRQAEFLMTEEVTELGETVVVVSYHCQSEWPGWNYLSGAWHCLFLICATVLAFQMRGMKGNMNETQILAMMIYSHFVFVVLRVVTFLLEGPAILSASSLEGTRSLIYSLDTISAVLIYFAPKLWTSDAMRSMHDPSATTALAKLSFAATDDQCRRDKPSNIQEYTTENMVARYMTTGNERRIGSHPFLSNVSFEDQQLDDMRQPGIGPSKGCELNATQTKDFCDSDMRSSGNSNEAFSRGCKSVALPSIKDECGVLNSSIDPSTSVDFWEDVDDL